MFFERTESGWSQVAKLTDSDMAAYSYFGSSGVSISGDYAIVAAIYDDYGRGSAYVFERTESGWSQAAKLTASDRAAGDNFGHSVSISGDYAIVGACGYNNKTGSAYIFDLFPSDPLANAILSLQVASGLNPSGFTLSRLDTNGDGKIGLENAIYALQVIGGI